MSERSTEQIRELLDSLYCMDSERILAPLIRLLGDFDLAEEARRRARFDASQDELAFGGRHREIAWGQPRLEKRRSRQTIPTILRRVKDLLAKLKTRHYHHSLHWELL